MSYIERRIARLVAERVHASDWSRSRHPDFDDRSCGFCDRAGDLTVTVLRDHPHLVALLAAQLTPDSEDPTDG